MYVPSSAAISLHPFILSIAGIDASRITLSIMIGLILERPEVQRKIHAELDDVLGTVHHDPWKCKKSSISSLNHTTINMFQETLEEFLLNSETVSFTQTQCCTSQ